MAFFRWRILGDCPEEKLNGKLSGNMKIPNTLVVVVVVVVVVKIHAHFPHVCGTYFTTDTSYLLWLKGKRVHQGRE